ncbi:MAG: hypothetical protein D6729_11945 [Deltaproteobacteria bacterium]|nr:MAG: hypothetical protein D6729_11945 [Deltaproteobacteria bacterium]
MATIRRLRPQGRPTPAGPPPGGRDAGRVPQVHGARRAGSAPPARRRSSVVRRSAARRRTPRASLPPRRPSRRLHSGARGAPRTIPRAPRPAGALARRAVLALAALLCATGVNVASWAENPAWPNRSAPREALIDPANWPDDPAYGFDPDDLSVARGQWNLWSFTPPQVADRLSPEERAMGVGLHADRAWQLTTGRFDVTIAVTDSGFLWDTADLVNKWRLNPGELPIPEGASEYDANGDGRFNVQDYTSATGHQQPTADTIVDSRVRDANGNGLLDPQDLILIFSDGSDDDGNGYTDDICGWDFLWDDNDPYDDARNGGQGYSHGTGEAKDSAAEGNNGIGGIGVCPDCSILPLRVSDSFVGDVNHFAEAVIYAVDNGASVVQEALGTIDATPFMQAAIDYAYEKGVLVVASAADETSYHHNYPGSAERTLYVHAIVYDSHPRPWTEATTFLNFNNCTNYGGHLALSTPGEGCSSEATGISAGHAGLVYSMAREVGLDPPLSANEAYQLMVMTADDIDVEGSENDPTKFPSDVGWDHHFGYGRNNARNSVEWIRDGRIPPEALITEPRWFETISLDEGPLRITGEVDARRSSHFDYTVEIAPGVAPREGEWKVVAEETGVSAPVRGLLAEVSLADFATFEGPPPNAHAFAVTARVRVTDAEGNRGEYRKSFFVHRDESLWPGFPLYLGASGEASPRLVDLDGDGADEIVLALADGSLHVLEADGSEAPGFPVQVSPIVSVEAHGNGSGLSAFAAPPRQAIVASPAVGDLDGDGAQEIVVATLDGEVHAFTREGVGLAAFPVRLDPAHSAWTGVRPGDDSTPERPTQEIRILEYGIFASPVLYDLDGDGDLEIVVAGLDGYLYAWHHDGSLVEGFPVEVRDPEGAPDGGVLQRMRARILSTPAIGDLDGDGDPEIVVGTNEVYQGGLGNAARGYAIHHDGTRHAGGPFLPGWPVALCCYADILPWVGRGVPASPALAELDGRPGPGGGHPHEPLTAVRLPLHRGGLRHRPDDRLRRALQRRRGDRLHRDQLGELRRPDRRRLPRVHQRLSLPRRSGRGDGGHAAGLRPHDLRVEHGSRGRRLPSRLPAGRRGLPVLHELRRGRRGRGWEGGDGERQRWLPAQRLRRRRCPIRGLSQAHRWLDDRHTGAGRPGRRRPPGHRGEHP